MKVIGSVAGVVFIAGAIMCLLGFGPGEPIIAIPMTPSWVIELPTAISAWWVAIILLALLARVIYQLIQKWRRLVEEPAARFFLGDNEDGLDLLGSAAAMGIIILIVGAVIGWISGLQISIGTVVLISLVVGILIGCLCRQPEMGLGLWLGTAALGTLVSLACLEHGASDIIRQCFLFGGCGCLGWKIGAYFKKLYAHYQEKKDQQRETACRAKLAAMATMGEKKE